MDSRVFLANEIVPGPKVARPNLPSRELRREFLDMQASRLWGRRQWRGAARLIFCFAACHGCSVTIRDGPRQAAENRQPEVAT